VQGVPDVGAYEVQRGRFVLRPGGIAVEGPALKVVTVERQDGFEGTARVHFSTIAGSASAADFGLISNLTLVFQDNQETFGLGLTIAEDAVVEPFEVFTVALGAPPGTTLGTPASTTVTILDPGFNSVDEDDIDPPPPVITSPAAGAVLNIESLPGQVVVSGTATDEVAVNFVQVSVSFDNGPFTPFSSAVLASTNAKSTAWSANLPVSGGATLVTIRARTRDAGGQTSPVTTRTIKLLHPLGVLISGMGSVSPAAYAPRSFRELGTSHTLTAKPAAGEMFAGWTVLGADLDDIGTFTEALDRPRITFLHRPNLFLVANFVDNPFDDRSESNVQLAGTYTGLVDPRSDPSSLSTEGFFQATVTATGAFSANLQLDGLIHIFNGAFDHEGDGRFGPSRARFLRIARVGKPTILVQIFMSGMTGSASPSVRAAIRTLDGRDDLIGFTDVIARRAFDGTSGIPPSLNVIANEGRPYSVISRPLPLADQPPGFDEVFYPQGAGFGRMTVTPGGRVTLTGLTLADGSVVTASTLLHQATTAGISFHEVMTAPMFIPLYNRKGFFRCTLKFDPADPDAPMLGESVMWLRPPISTAQYYPKG
jgi:hypothetical protein